MSVTPMTEQPATIPMVLFTLRLGEPISLVAVVVAPSTPAVALDVPRFGVVVDVNAAPRELVERTSAICLPSPRLQHVVL